MLVPKKYLKNLDSFFFAWDIIRDSLYDHIHIIIIITIQFYDALDLWKRVSTRFHRKKSLKTEGKYISLNHVGDYSVAQRHHAHNHILHNNFDHRYNIQVFLHWSQILCYPLRHDVMMNIRWYGSGNGDGVVLMVNGEKEDEDGE